MIDNIIRRTLGFLRSLAGDSGPKARVAAVHAQPQLKPRVLCVDDNPTILKVLERQLGDPYQVSTAGGSEQALEAIERDGPFDVIISDLQMPGAHGLTFLTRARTLAPDTERIILTGFPDPTTMAVARSAGGAAKLLTKPCSTQDLRAAVDEAVARRRSRR